MISPSEIKLKAERKYKTYLQSIISKEDIFPLFIIGNKKPSKSIPEFKKELNDTTPHISDQKFCKTLIFLRFGFSMIQC